MRVFTVGHPATRNTASALATHPGHAVILRSGQNSVIFITQSAHHLADLQRGTRCRAYPWAMDLAHEAPVGSDSAHAPASDQHAHVLDIAGHHVPDLVLFRRDLHANPELSRAEFRTTAAIAAKLERAGLSPRVRSVGSGLVCDIVPAGA